VTPYTKGGDIHEVSLRALVSLNLSKGVRGFYVGGSTAEAFMLSLPERKRILEIVADENGGRGTIISHVGNISTDQTIELARHAREVGVDAVSAVPPFYYGFTQDEVVAHYLAIVEAVDLPLILYNFPANAGFSLTPRLIERLRRADERIVGLKHTSMDLFDLERFTGIDDEFVVLSGHDEVLLGALAMGAHGAVGSTFNVMPELYIDMIAAFERGEMAAAQALQRRANAFIGHMVGSTGLPQVKAALELLGIECNGCRRPILDLEPRARSRIEQTMIDIGLL
jgi:N-acetylneuraminate lyase